MSDALTQDAFLGGKLQIWQPQKGYRAGTDPVLLAASIDAKPDQSVLELGCGVGVAALCLNARVGGVALTGVELQEGYATLAMRNGVDNGARFDVVNCDLAAMPVALRQRQFDHVMMNPPYFDRGAGSKSEDAGKDIAFGGDTPLRDWIDIGIKRLAPKGYLTIIQRVERLAEVLTFVDARLGSIDVRPIAPRVDRPANLFLLRARLNGKAPLALHSPLIMHEGTEHIGDRESYTPHVKAILRDAAPLFIAC